MLSLEDRDAEELVLVLRGYYKLLTDRDLDIIQETAPWLSDKGRLKTIRTGMCISRSPVH